MAAVTERATLAKSVAEKKIARFDIHQIIQHAGLMVSFTVLVLTGLPLKYANNIVSQWWVSVWGGIDIVRSTHHIFAYMIVVVSFYHLVYIIYSVMVMRRPFPYRIIPSLQDAVNLVQEIAYFIGIRKETPKYDRFNWREKFDYWALFWGMPVMAGSGFILMYPVLVTNLLPGWVVPAALIAHSDEAMLALTWIFMIHIFFNHFSPGTFPMNTTIFTGKMSEERYRKDHPLEYNRIKGDESGE